MWFLIVLFVLLFHLLLASMPLIVEARGRVGVRGGVVHARIYVLGLIPIPIRFRLYLFGKPYFTLMIGKKQVHLLKKRRKRIATGFKGIRLLRLDTRTTVGIEGEPAVSVQLAGTTAVLFSMLTTRVAESGSATARLSAGTVIRIGARARAIVEPVRLIAGIVRGRIAQRKAANNTHKTNEKRKTYASC